MNFIIILLLAIVTIIIQRNILCAFPGTYFSIQDIITTNHNEINLFGFLLRFVLILIFSLVIAFIYKGDIESIIIYSILVSFLLIWPFILNQIIYRNKHEEKLYEEFYPKKKMTNKLIRNYLIVYFMYSIICILVSLISIPIYNLVKNNPTILYKYLLEKYILLDQFQQSVISNTISGIILIILSLFARKILNKILRTNFK
jgi:hypothetical protein